MSGRFPGNIIYIIQTILVFICGTGALAQKNLSGNLGMPFARVITIGTDRVTVNDVTGFLVTGGDTLLLMQMQGVKVQVAPVFGNLQDKFGEPGLWEFLITQSVNTGTKEIIFRNNIKNSYDTKGNIQVVKVPFYNSANVTGNLTVDGWDPVKKTGGVLALIVGRSLRLSADINLSGKGFSGGLETTGIGECRQIDDALNGKDNYPDSFTNAGLKGEGAANYTEFGSLIDPGYIKGFGPAYTGGGGGNGKYSGGGGGANRGNGGAGGDEDGSCAAPREGGSGGLKGEYFPSLMNRLFLGGGGGASTRALTGATTGPGGSGGGIIIIIADSLLGNGGNIIVSGQQGSNASGNAGAGGGGAGGSIALSVGNYGTAPYSLVTQGGKGGDRTGIGGEGGGGSGGLLWVSKDITANITFVTAGGASGTSLSPSATPGQPGDKKLAFKANLNGFLFNSIRSSVTGGQIDSVCSNMIPPKITGTTPVGGTEPYTYLWEKSYNLSVWIPVATGTVDYTPTVVETATVWFRRTITDTSIPTALVDVSKPVQFIVQPFIKNNIIGTSDTICFAQNPPALTSKATLQDGNGIFSFTWQVSTDNTVYSLPAAAYSNESYTPPPALQVTSWYRRTVISGRCIDSSALVKITVLDTIKNNNIISPAEEICYGMSFINLTATTTPALEGGDGTFRYRWQGSTDAALWADAPGTINLPGYNPVETSPVFPGVQYFRRVVYSGNDNVCENRSQPVKLTSWPVIGNNNISGNQTICTGSTPAQLSGTSPVNGNGVYTYLWQSRRKSTSWSAAPGPGPVNLINYQPPPLSDTTWFRRVVNSSACSDTSNIIVVNVHKPVINNNIQLVSGITDTTVCSGAIPRVFAGSLPGGGTEIPGDYAYIWEKSLSEFSGYAGISGATGKDYQSTPLVNATASPVTHYFRRLVASGFCSSISPQIIKVTVLPSIANNVITPDKPAVCFNTSPVISGTPLTGGAGGTPVWLWIQSPTGIAPWSPASGINNQQNYTPPPMTTPLFFRRVILSGPANCCIDTSNIVAITINPLPTGQITTISDTTVCGGSQVPVKIRLSGASKWNVIYTENGTQVSLNGILSPDTTILINKTPSVASATFNYALFRVTDKNGCEAVTLSGTRKIDVYRVPAANAGADASVCGPRYTLAAVPSAGTGTWTFPADVVMVTAAGPVVTVAIDSVTAPASATKRFYWEEINWTCRSKDSVDITFFKRTGIADAGPDRDLYTYDYIDTLKAVKPLVGTGSWSVMAGDAVIVKDSIATQLSDGLNRFEWKIVNGNCESKDEMTINVSGLKIPEGFSPNGDGLNDEFTIQGLDLNFGESTLIIMNSAGSEVYRTTNVGGKTWQNWNGESSGKILPEGTYYYLFTVKSAKNGALFRESGFVILKRSKTQ